MLNAAKTHLESSQYPQLHDQVPDLTDFLSNCSHSTDERETDK